jgi:hypothetical protein
MGEYFEEGEYWAGRKYLPSESDMVTSDVITSDGVTTQPASVETVVATTPEVAASGDADCFVQQKPLGKWLATTFPRSAFATRMAVASTSCVVQEPAVKKSAVFACP